MVDVAGSGVGTDDEAGDPQAVTILVDSSGDHMIVKATPVIPGQEDGRRAPIRAAHSGVDETGDIGLAGRNRGRGMLAHGLARDDPGDGREGARPGVLVEVGHRLNVAELAVGLDGVKER